MWIYNFLPSLVRMVARVSAGIYTGYYIATAPSPISDAWIFTVSPTTFPTFQGFIPRLQQHFPYGYLVDPD